jgi:hypothetical protein
VNLNDLGQLRRDRSTLSVIVADVSVGAKLHRLAGVKVHQ